MNVANLGRMLEHELGEEYDYKDHKWVNQKLPCGCLVAVCIDVEPNQADSKLASRNFTKISNLRAYIKEALTSSDESMKSKIDEFKKEAEATQEELRELILAKRKEYDFPTATDFNSEYYYIRIKKNPSCTND